MKRYLTAVLTAVLTVLATALFFAALRLLAELLFGDFGNGWKVFLQETAVSGLLFGAVMYALYIIASVRRRGKLRKKK